MGFKFAGILMILMAAMTAGGYWYYNDTQGRLATLVSNAARLETAIASSEATISALQNDYEAMRMANEVLNEEFVAIRRQNDILSDKLSRHDLGFLAASRPELVENIINSASDNAIRCFELLSGAELTERELDATNANSFNSECPWLYDTFIESGRLWSLQ